MPIIDLLPLSSNVEHHSNTGGSNDGTIAREADTQGVSHSAELTWASETHSMESAKRTNKSTLSEHDMLML